MKLTEQILKKLILEEMSGNQQQVLEYLEELEANMSPHYDALRSNRVRMAYLTKSYGPALQHPEGVNEYVPPTPELLQAGIDSLAEEIKTGAAQEDDWDKLFIHRFASGYPANGTLRIQIEIYRDGRKKFFMEQSDKNNNLRRGRSYYQPYLGTSISFHALIEFFTASDEDLTEMLKDRLNTYGYQTTSTDTM